MKDILNSEDFADFCENYNCDVDCPLFLYKLPNGTGYSCSSRFYKIKFEAEKAKVEKLKSLLSKPRAKSSFSQTKWNELSKEIEASDGK